MFFCDSGLLDWRAGNGTLNLQTPIGEPGTQMERSAKKWSTALGTMTTPEELLGVMTRDRFREIVRATAPLLDSVQHLRAFVTFACANPRLGPDFAMCADMQQPSSSPSSKWPYSIVTKAAPVLRLADSALGVVFNTQCASQLGTMVRVIETLNALRDGVCAIAEPLVSDPPVLQNMGWHQTDDDFRMLRECEVQSRSTGLRSRPAPVATRSLALFPDQCGLVCASMRDCANGDDLVAELLLGPDAKMNWDPKSSEPEFYRIVQPPAQTVSRTVASGATRQPDSLAEARAKTHFGDSHMRPSYPERSSSKVAVVRNTKLMTPDEVLIASDEQTVGRPLRRTKPQSVPPPPSQSEPPPVAHQKDAKTKKAVGFVHMPSEPQKPLPVPLAVATAAAVQAPAQKRKQSTQFDSVGRVVKPASASHTGRHRRGGDLPLTASMLDFMEFDKR